MTARPSGLRRLRLIFAVADRQIAPFPPRRRPSAFRRSQSGRLRSDRALPIGNRRAGARMKSLIIFDLDGTLAESKSSSMRRWPLFWAGCSGSSTSRSSPAAPGDNLKSRCLPSAARRTAEKAFPLPTCGAKFYRFDGAWKKLYSEDFSVDEKRKIIDALK